MTLPMSNPAAAPDPTKWSNASGLGLRLQCFLVVRDADRRIACVRLKDQPEVWFLPGETVQPNEDLHAAAQRVAKLWFGQPLDARVADVLTWPDDGDKKWYVLFVYEARAPPGGLKAPEDTAQIAFVPAGKAPGPWGKSHADVFARIQA